MVKIPLGLDESQIWNLTLSAPDHIQKTLLGKSHDISELIHRGRKSAPDLPFLLYCETRDADNYLRSFSIFSNEDQHTYEEMHAGRELISKSDFANKQLFGYEEEWRGIILGRFCKIDFVLDVLVCISNNYYSNSSKPKKVMRELRDWDGLFSSAEKKLRFLYQQGVITKQTYSFVNESRLIRNKLAHQYIPKSPIVSDLDVAAFGSFQLAIIGIFNYSWHFLMTDFVHQQDPIYQWLKHLD